MASLPASSCSGTSGVDFLAELDAFLELLPDQLYSIAQRSRIARDVDQPLVVKLASKVGDLVQKLMSICKVTELRNKVAAFGRDWSEATKDLVNERAELPSLETLVRASNAFNRAWLESLAGVSGKPSFAVYRDAEVRDATLTSHEATLPLECQDKRTSLDIIVVVACEEFALQLEFLVFEFSSPSTVTSGRVYNRGPYVTSFEEFEENDCSNAPEVVQEVIIPSMRSASDVIGSRFHRPGLRRRNVRTTSNGRKKQDRRTKVD